MQIMIDISESDFNYIKNHGTEIHPRVYHAFEKAIILAERNGEMTNQEEFIQIFGVDAWKQMVDFSGVAEQFKEYWTSPYDSRSDIVCEGDTVCHCNLKENAQLIAEILDEDSIGEVYTPHQKYELEMLRLWIDTKFSEISKGIDGFINKQEDENAD